MYMYMNYMYIIISSTYIQMYIHVHVYVLSLSFVGESRLSGMVRKCPLCKKNDMVVKKKRDGL